MTTKTKLCKLCGAAFETYFKSRQQYCSWSCGFKEKLAQAQEGKGACECWDWKGGLFKNGYGRFSIALPRIEYAHRLCYILHWGEIPTDYVIMHHCDNRRFCNPFHLSAGTQQDNVTDKMRKGRYNYDRTYYEGSAHSNSVLTDEEVIQIRSSAKPTKYWTDKLKVSRQAINRVKNYLTYKNVNPT